MGVFDGQSPDASVALGPMEAGPFVPFEAGDMVNLVWGPQGSPMLEFRMQVDGHESENCYLHEVSAELSTGETAQGGGSVRARCGSTLGLRPLPATMSMAAAETEAPADAWLPASGDERLPRANNRSESERGVRVNTRARLA